MTKKNNNDIEIRKLSAGAVFKLVQILDCNEGWKELMAVIPIDGQEGNPLKYGCIHISLIQTAGRCQKRPYSEILLEEWGTSGRRRPTVSVLYQCLLKAQLYRAADFVASDLLKVPLPSRPVFGPAALVEDPRPDPDYTPTAPPPPVTPPVVTELVEPDTSQPIQLNYAVLESATEQFSESRVLGGGGWGSVYLANLPQLGAIAVKRLHISNSVIPGDPHQQFQNEVQILAQLSHTNLLPLLGYSCDGPSPCLAYKYMKHGSLLDRLACKNSKTPLLWRTRVEIALGTARGLSHLHNFMPKPLVHRDVKSANILLDDNLTPKVGDFGLVRLGASGNVTQTAAMTTNIIGTSAYMAPEAHRGDVSAKMDIFSFGVVLLELVTGLPPLDEDRDGHDLVTHIEDTDDRESLLDKKAGPWPPVVGSRMFDLADSCLAEKRNRPTSTIVIQKLESILA